MSKHNDNGVRMLTKSMIHEISYVDKTRSENASSFQSIFFEVIDSCCFYNGRNNTIHQRSNHVYDLRRSLKRDNNPA